MVKLLVGVNSISRGGCLKNCAVCFWGGGALEKEKKKRTSEIYEFVQRIEDDHRIIDVKFSIYFSLLTCCKPRLYRNSVDPTNQLTNHRNSKGHRRCCDAHAREDVTHRGNTGTSPRERIKAMRHE